ncbi:nucleotidyltransferase AbiEii toxin of type IV toxin-antitoxin system [Lentzea atacamensis]|uniref:Nucleotidyltransferase AbiEii toxin of type IV toxin-antitoxin system n=1 Tax=Lentzea atacamensis TaxID=531938 RepID=A0ABX9E3W1_9PSEU|nr:nucleotidyl transferase AbiEii/AbiGii toxin family protein [Lentzea atacamensis]RAS63741.1 nucleotidyltransferase AbiEii toxin of type IV toxin-antitoxin system [Lentzea atacamensis]
MSRPTKTTPGGRAYLDLQNRARRERRSTQELQTLYVLERWLARLAASPHAGQFVLKGGMLLAVFDARRPTADADLLARNLANDEESVIARVVDVARVELDPEDGVVFLVDTATAQSIRDDDLYAGVRITMSCRISTASVKLKLDINFGDPVTPAPRLLDLPSQRPGIAPVPVLGYPIETVLAEKTSTAIALREANTRVRDYVDLYTLTGRQAVSYESVRSALHATTHHRGVEIRPLSAVVGELAEMRQQAYSAFKKRLGPDAGHLPDSFGDVVAAVVEFVDPLTAGDPRGAWNPDARKWV